MNLTANGDTMPQSMRHKQILELAENNPDASMQEIADRIPSVTVDLIEEVLHEHGDPSAGTESPTPASDAQPFDSLDLSETQREILETIAKDPAATQQELADTHDVSPATVSTRVNAIDGFEWESRKAFVRKLYDDNSKGIDQPNTADNTVTMDAFERIDDRLTTIENELSDWSGNAAGDGVFADPDLAHKIAHACVHSDAITKNEELQVFKTILQK